MPSSNWIVVGLWGMGVVFSLSRRRWMDTCFEACFAVYAAMSIYQPAVLPWQTKYVFLAVGVTIVVVGVMKEYKVYKNKLLDAS